MEMNDMVIISVDDHISEPPDMFKNHLSGALLKSAPRMVKDDNGKAVPIDKALEVLTGSTEGQELYYNLLQLATSPDAFDQIDEAAVDEAELKN